MSARVILASASPRRRELLGVIVPEFDVEPADVDESAWNNQPLRSSVRGAAMAKALRIAEAHPEDVVIGADTIVTVIGQALGKPASPAEAAEMLRMLSGREHTVMTGLAIVSRLRTESVIEESRVQFAPLTEEQIQAYVRTGEPMDKAGAYGIQGRASAFIERVEGCYFNIVGLPLFRLAAMLPLHGVTPWELWEPDGRDP